MTELENAVAKVLMDYGVLKNADADKLSKKLVKMIQNWKEVKGQCQVVAGVKLPPGIRLRVCRMCGEDFVDGKGGNLCERCEYESRK